MAYLLKILEGMSWYKYLNMIHIFDPFPTLHVHVRYMYILSLQERQIITTLQPCNMYPNHFHNPAGT